MKVLLRLSVVLVLILTSCKGSKAVVGSATADGSMSVGNLIAAHESATPNFKTLAGRVQVAYDDGRKSQSMTVSLRMEKDKVIWIKAAVLGITFAKAKITPEKVSYYETLGNTYFDGDFSLLSEWLGTELNFEQCQAILLGQSIFQLDKTYRSSIKQNKYLLEPKTQEDFVHALFLNPDNFKVNKATAGKLSEDKGVILTYDAFQKLEGSFYPTQAHISAMDGTDLTQIDLKYKKIDLNVSVSFPFTIPNGYTEIQLTR